MSPRTSAVCPWCERFRPITADGSLYKHRAVRIGPGGREHIAGDDCPGSGLTPEEAAR